MVAARLSSARSATKPMSEGSSAIILSLMPIPSTVPRYNFPAMIMTMVRGFRGSPGKGKIEVAPKQCLLSFCVRAPGFRCGPDLTQTR